jgi:hypothetical protein
MENSGYRRRDAGHSPFHRIMAEYLEIGTDDLFRQILLAIPQSPKL